MKDMPEELSKKERKRRSIEKQAKKRGKHPPGK